MYPNSFLILILFFQAQIWSGTSQNANYPGSQNVLGGPVMSSGGLNAMALLVTTGITTPEKLEDFRLDLAKLTPGTSIDLTIRTSNMTLFPDDFFDSYNITKLKLQNCTMSSLPYDLIRPICSNNLQYFEISNGTMASPALQLTPGGFENCTGLPEIWLQNVIQEVPSEAFRGLDNLKRLTLQLNQIQRMDVGFEGIQDTLEYLNMAVNPIISVPKDAFKGWTKMTFLVLSGSQIETLENGTFDSLGPNPSVVLAANPLNCTCDLEWLQIWYQKNPIDKAKYSAQGFKNDPQAACANPIKVPLANFDYKNGPYKCGAKQIMSFGILAILAMTFISQKMLWEFH